MFGPHKQEYLRFKEDKLRQKGLLTSDEIKLRAQVQMSTCLISFDRKLFYSLIHSTLGMSEGINETEKKSSLKEKLDLKNKLDDMDLGVTMPSTNVNEYIRVLKLARKPSREEFSMIAKVSMAGIGLIGTMGFVIYALLTEVLPRLLPGAA